MKVIKFRSPETAEKVRAHLYGVTIDGAKLFFSKFDQVAFDLVINLEKLSRADYSVLGTEGDRDGPWISRPSRLPCQPLRATSLNVSLYIIPRFSRISMHGRGMQLTFGDPVYHQVRLLVCGTFRLTEEALDEIPLIVNQALIEFVNLIQTTTTVLREQVALAFCQVDGLPDPGQYILRLEDGDHVQSFRFYPAQVSITVDRT